MRIGIIEDDNLLRKALDTSLKNQGYTTILAGSRKEAIKNIDSSVDLLIVDIGLPDGDGINLYQELQKNGKIPAIFLTAKDDEKDMLKAFDTGADDYVVKPFNIDVLLVRIYNLLAQREKLKSVYSKNFSLQSMGIEVETTSADEKFMQKLFKIIEKYLTDPDLKVDKICEEMGFSRSNLYRKLKAITDLPLNDLIRHKRLEIATQMLKQTEMNITEIATATGFSTLAYFTKCFKSAYGVSPSEYQKSYSGHTDIDTIRE